MTYEIYIYKIIIIIFFLSLYGILYNRKNIIYSLIFIEIAFLAMNLFLIVLGWFYKILNIKLYIIYFLSLTAIETCVGLVLFILFYKNFRSINISDYYQILRRR